MTQNALEKQEVELKFSPQFGALLSVAVKRVAKHRRCKIFVIDDEIGLLLGRAGRSATRRWKGGHIPDYSTFDGLVRYLVEQSVLNLDQLHALADAAQYPYGNELAKQLFPSSPELCGLQRVNSTSLQPTRPQSLELGNRIKSVKMQDEKQRAEIVDGTSLAVDRSRKHGQRNDLSNRAAQQRTPTTASIVVRGGQNKIQQGKYNINIGTANNVTISPDRPTSAQTSFDKQLPELPVPTIHHSELQAIVQILRLEIESTAELNNEARQKCLHVVHQLGRGLMRDHPDLNKLSAYLVDLRGFFGARTSTAEHRSVILTLIEHIETKARATNV